MKMNHVFTGLFVAATAGSAMALPGFPSGPYTFDLEDRSSLYAGTTPLAPGAIQFNQETGQFEVNTGGNEGTVNQKSIYQLKDISLGQVRNIGANGMKDVVFQAAQSPAQTFLPGGTGVSYGLNLGTVKTSGTKAILNFVPDRSFAFTDLVPSSAGAANSGGLSGGLATAANGFGGLVDLYYNAANSTVFGVNGDGDFFSLPDAASGNRLGFPDFTVDAGNTNGLVLFARGVFTPLMAAGLQHPSQANFGLVDANTVLYEDFDAASNTGAGFGFLNVIEASPGFVFTPDFFGAGRDLRLDFQTTAATDANGNPINTDGFNVTSTDPVQGSAPIPEPITAGLGAFSVLALAGYVTGRNRKA